MGAGGLIGQPGAVEGSIEKIAAAVASEYAAGAIGAVRARSQADDPDGGIQIAKSGHRPGPVGLLGIRAPPGYANLLAVLAQTHAFFARFNPLVQLIPRCNSCHGANCTPHKCEALFSRCGVEIVGAHGSIGLGPHQCPDNVVAFEHTVPNKRALLPVAHRRGEARNAICQRRERVL